MTSFPEEWEDGSLRDYSKFESVGGDTASDCPEYTENVEYDENGWVVHYDSAGILDDTAEDAETETILWIDYTYNDNGTLMQRDYYHNPYAFGTWYQVWISYFDGLGRLEYEDIYITHGYMYYYYIYADESGTPAYCLYLDNNMGSWIPEFYQY